MKRVFLVVIMALCMVGFVQTSYADTTGDADWEHRKSHCFDHVHEYIDNDTIYNDTYMRGEIKNNRLLLDNNINQTTVNTTKIGEYKTQIETNTTQIEANTAQIVANEARFNDYANSSTARDNDLQSQIDDLKRKNPIGVGVDILLYEKGDFGEKKGGMYELLQNVKVEVKYDYSNQETSGYLVGTIKLWKNKK